MQTPHGRRHPSCRPLPKYYQVILNDNLALYSMCVWLLIPSTNQTRLLHQVTYGHRSDATTPKLIINPHPVVLAQHKHTHYFSCTVHHKQFSQKRKMRLKNQRCATFICYYVSLYNMLPCMWHCHSACSLWLGNEHTVAIEMILFSSGRPFSFPSHPSRLVHHYPHEH